MPPTFVSPASLLPPPSLSIKPKVHALPSLKLSPSTRCSLRLVTEAPSKEAGELLPRRPSPAELSRTVMELSSAGTLSTLTHDGCPLGLGARFVVDAEGAPALCLREPELLFPLAGRSSFHVRFEQSGSRTPQCTLVGSLNRPDNGYLLKKLCAKWEKKFGEEVDENLVYVISVKRVLQMEDFKEDGVWVTSSEYTHAEPDPLRNFAEQIVDEMNSRHAEDVQRLCSIYLDTDFQVTDSKMIWVDRLGFDLYIHSGEEIFSARIPFPREVTDEKGVKSWFNSMSHLAWEIEKSYVLPEFEKVKCLKKVR